MHHLICLREERKYSQVIMMYKYRMRKSAFIAGYLLIEMYHLEGFTSLIKCRLLN